jgi:hypothetical protein
MSNQGVRGKMKLPQTYLYLVSHIKVMQLMERAGSEFWFNGQLMVSPWGSSIVSQNWNLDYDLFLTTTSVAMKFR